MDRNQLLNDAETAQLYALDGRQAKSWTALPGIITAVDFGEMTVSVQPTIQGIQTLSDGSTQYVNLPLLIHVPLCFPSAGGFTLTLPVTPGDECLLVFSSRCIDAWWALGGVQIPMEKRMQDLSDAFCILGPKSQPNVIGAISETNAQLRSNDGTCYLEITPGGQINLTAPGGMNVTTPTMNFAGVLDVTGEVISNGIPLSTHVHGGVTGGGDETSGPIP